MVSVKSCCSMVLVAMMALMVRAERFECEEEGFFRDPENCDKFVRCYLVRGIFKAKTFDCAPGTIFDSKNSICNYAEASTPPCDSVIEEEEEIGFACPSEGVFEDTDDCTQFWLCEQDESGYNLVAELFACPGGFVFDQLSARCTYGSTINCTVGGARSGSSRARKLSRKQMEQFFAQKQP